MCVNLLLLLDVIDATRPLQFVPKHGNYCPGDGNSCRISRALCLGFLVFTGGAKNAYTAVINKTRRDLYFVQVINANVPSLNTQRRLTKSQNGLATSLERLSSGLRINSAKDDAAGMAIGNRMSSQINGMNVAIRNTNDGVSLLQTAEGTLQSSGDMLRRIRELAVQSANATNSQSDRQALNAEVSQLVAELDRIGKASDFNGIKLLDGTFTAQNFQVGANVGQTIPITLGSATANDIGIYTVSTNNSILGIDAAAGGQVKASTTPRVLTGADAAAIAAAYQPQTISIAHYSGYVLSTIYTTSGEDALSLGGDFSHLPVSPPLYDFPITSTTIDFSNTSGIENGDIISCRFEFAGHGGAADISFVRDQSTFPSLEADFANAINNPGVAYLSAAVGSGTVVLTNSIGENIGLSNFSVNHTIPATSSIVFGGQTLTEGTAIDSAVQVGSLTITVPDEGYTVSSDATSGNVYGLAAGKDATYRQGMVDATAGNNVVAQTLTINGLKTQTVSVQANEQASSIAAKVNGVTDSTGVEATAHTTATLSNVNPGGGVSFKLNGVSVSASVNDNDFGQLASAVNQQSAKTGIVAQFDRDGNTLTLTNSEGVDIVIADFSGSTKPVYMDVKGGGGIPVRLNDTGATPDIDLDSTVIGGKVEFKSNRSFSVASEGGLFSGSANQVGQLQAVQSIDITSVEGANRTIGIVDGALETINEIRSDAGAVQNRFESTMSNMAISSENLSAARSRIMDADYAAETSELTRNQILKQAGTAMLAQANSLPQNVLSLLPK